MNEMLAPPANASATSSAASVGASVANVIATPNADAASTSGRIPVLPRAATISPPITAPTPIAAVMKPKPLGADVQPAAGHHRQRDLKLVCEAPDGGHHQQRDRELGRPAHVAQALAELALGRGAWARSVVSVAQCPSSISDATTATKLAALTRKQTPSPTVAIRIPATAGPDDCGRR